MKNFCIYTNPKLNNGINHVGRDAPGTPRVGFLLDLIGGASGAPRPTHNFVIPFLFRDSY